MKILTISNLYPPNVMGGAEILTKNLVEALRKEHEVFVLTASCSQSFPPHVIPTLRRWNPDSPPTFFSRLKTHRENQIVTQKILKEINPDVILVSDLKGLGYAPLRIAQQAKPTVTFLHDQYSFAEARPDPKRSRSMLEHFRKWIAGFVIFGLPIRLNHVISNSTTTLKHQPPFVRVKKATVVGVGIPKPLQPNHHQYKKRTHQNQILYFGRIVEEKGVHLTIEALRVLRTDLGIDPIHLNIVGFARNHHYLSHLKRLVRQYNLGEFVSFRENVSEREKYQHIYDADVFVFPSIWEEGLGQTYLEAMSCGLPCVCAPAGGAKEILLNEVNCLVFAPNNVNQFAQAIQRMLFDEPLRERIIRDARQMVEHEFSMPAFTQRCLVALENCTQPV